MILTCKDISKSYGVDDILDKVSFIVEERDKVGILGVNGAGKTTLLKILTGEESKDSGEIIIPKDVKLGYLAQMTDSISLENSIYTELLSVFNSLLALEEEIRNLEKSMSVLKDDDLKKAMERYSRLSHEFEEQKGYEYKSRIRGVVKGLSFTDDEASQPIGQLSGGQKTRVALGKLLLTSPDILLLDEPTNHLDIDSVEWLENFLRSYNGTIILISHDRYFLDRTSTKIIEIENKKATLYNGGYDYYVNKKDADRLIQLKHYTNQQKEIKRQEEVIKTLKSYNREKSIKRAESREKLLEKVELVDAPENLPDKMRIRIEPKYESGRDVLSADNLSKVFDDFILFRNISFEIKRGEKIALIGPNGVGKTTLFRIVLDKIRSSTGTVKFGANVTVGYYDQEHQNLDLEKTIIDEISNSFPKLTLGEIRNVLSAFVFTGDDVFKKISSLSGGERGRVALAKVMLSNANFLILDEPTNHLDIFSKEILENALNLYTGTILFISHDRYFVNKVAQKIFEFSMSKIDIYDGNYDYYLEKKQSNLAQEAVVEEDKSSSLKDDWLKKKEDQSNERRRITAIAKTEKEISDIEDLIEDIDLLMTKEEVYSDSMKSKENYDKKVALEAELGNLYKKWEELNK